MFLLKLSDRADEDLWGCWIFVLSSLALAWMCPGTVSTNSNTAGLLGEIHLPSLGMPKRLWRCNSLILRREQCSSYCYGKSMWLSWRTASEDSFLRSHRAQAPNICRQHNQINEEKKKKKTVPEHIRQSYLTRRSTASQNNSVFTAQVGIWQRRWWKSESEDDEWCCSSLESSSALLLNLWLLGSPTCWNWSRAGHQCGDDDVNRLNSVKLQTSRPAQYLVMFLCDLIGTQTPIYQAIMEKTKLFLLKKYW